MDISVIIPVYNVELYLNECMESVICQLSSEDELILIDDGSTDRSWDICTEYQKKYDNVIVLHQSNQGAAAARNAGMEKANGQYLIFVDADDYVGSELLFTMKRYLKEGLDVLLFDADIRNDIDNQKKNNPYIHSPKLYRKVMTGADYIMQTFPKNRIVAPYLAMYKRSFLEEYHIKFPEGICYEDCFFHLQVMMSAYRVMSIDKKLYMRRYRCNSVMTSQITKKNCKDIVDTAILCWEYLNEKRVPLLYPDFAVNYVAASILSAEYVLSNVSDAQVMCREKERMRKCFIQKWCPFFERYASRLGEVVAYMWLLQREDIAYAASVEWLEGTIKKYLCGLPLSSKNRRVAVYGIGQHTKCLLDFYRYHIGEVNAELIFVQTEAKEEECFEGHKVLSVKDIPEEVGDIVISSMIYQEEMKQILLKNGIGDRTIYTLYDDRDLCDLVMAHKILTNMG